MSLRSKSASRGFSLIEMLVALVFISLLMAGMLRVYASSMSAMATNAEAMDANRTKRWAMTLVEDDFQLMGYFYYHPFRVIPTYVSVNPTSGQNALMIFPNQSATYTTYDTAFGNLITETVRYDEIQFLEDQPIQVQARLSAIPFASDLLTLNVLSGSLADVRTGDFVILMDEVYEICRVRSVNASGGTVTLDTSEVATQDQASGDGTGATKGLKVLTHQVGTDVMFVRPMQVVRYTVLPMALDPANPTSRIPCLVRDQAPYPTTGMRADIAWPAPTAAIPAGFTRTIVAENVYGQPTTGTPTLPNQYALRVDISPDNGTTWSRTGVTGNDWSPIAANLNSWLATNGRPGFQTISDSNNPVWYRNIPALFRVDVTVRTPVRRADPNNPTTRAYTYRSQSLLCLPRNFTHGL